VDCHIDQLLSTVCCRDTEELSDLHESRTGYTAVLL
jgi:hypothetical protein